MRLSCFLLYIFLQWFGYCTVSVYCFQNKRIMRNFLTLASVLWDALCTCSVSLPGKETPLHSLLPGEGLEPGRGGWRVETPAAGQDRLTWGTGSPGGLAHLGDGPGAAAPGV